MSPEDEAYVKQHLEQLKERLKIELEHERIERQHKIANQVLEKLPWIIAAVTGWLLFFAEMITRK